jgi:hypothetical protein
MRKVVVTLAFLILNLLSVPKTGLAQVRVRELGNCLVVTVHEGTGAPFNINDLCENSVHAVNFPNGRDFKQVYKDEGVFLGRAFEQAEEAYCRSSDDKKTCITRGLYTRIILTPSNFPFAGESRTRNSVDVFLTSGFVDFVELSARGYLLDVIANQQGTVATNGFKAWLDHMRSLGGKACDSRMTIPIQVPEGEKYDNMIRVGVHESFAFLFGHELAHVKTSNAGSKCGYEGNDPLQLEASCDRMSLTALMGDGSFLPPFILASNTAIWYWQNFQNPSIVRLFNPSPTLFTDLFPAANWKERSTMILRSWSSKCFSTTLCDRDKGVISCCPGWQEAVTDARHFIMSTPPTMCVR